MKNILRSILVFMVLVPGTPVLANSPTSALATCLVDNLNGKERKNLARWIFFSMAAHPELSAYADASPADIEESDQYVGKVITRLLTVDCPDQLRKASSADAKAVQKAFELVGQVAMRELMTNQNVAKALSNYSRHADIEKINGILNEE